MAWTRDEMAAIAARGLKDGDYVNLGIGIPTLVANHIPEGINVTLQSENGILGMGPFPFEGEEDADLINAGKQTVTANPGASFFDSATSFGMIRGGHINAAVLGALQVSGEGDIANWAVPGRDVLGVGGAMDLVVGAKRVIVTMTSTSSRGEPKIVAACTYPLTAKAAVDVVITERAVFRFRDALVLTELLGGATLDDVAAVTAAPYRVELD